MSIKILQNVWGFERHIQATDREAFQKAIEAFN
jgi:hypothetical protein